MPLRTGLLRKFSGIRTIRREGEGHRAGQSHDGIRSLCSADAKARLERMKTGLKNLLDLVSREPRGLTDFHLESTPIAIGATHTSTTLPPPKRPTGRRKPAEKA